MKQCLSIVCLVLVAVVFGAHIKVASARHADVNSSSLNPDIKWYGSNAAELSKMIAATGDKSPSYKVSSPPVAVFDWDNTTVKNDIGDATMFWMLVHNKVRQPANRDWRRTSPLLTDAAISALNVACDSQGEPLSPLKTGKNSPESEACADEILKIYDDGTTRSGAKAWKDKAATDTMEPAYAWTVQLQAGYTPDEIRKFARKTIQFNLNNEVGAKQTIGTKGDWNASIRVYDPIKDLIRTLQNNGFDVWITSASSQYLVDVFAEWVNIDPAHVIGVRPLVDSDGKTTPYFEGCGTYAEGNQAIITYKQGKRCWINKEIFGVTDPKQQLTSRSPTTFVAGDSDTDLFMLKDAHVMRLVLNRNKNELMCNAYVHLGKKDAKNGQWLINPMFIKPKAKKEDGYTCSKYKLPNQKDTVF